MLLPDVALLISENGRARAYIDLLIKAGLQPSKAIVVESPQLVQAPVEPNYTDLFDNVSSVKDVLIEAGIEISIVTAKHINDSEVVSKVRELKQSIVIFAGPSGSLLRKPYFYMGKQFLHVHPGKLPDYRGSTPMYYSLLNEGNITATAFIMAEAIDAGEILLEKTFPPPENKLDIDLIFDPYIRAKVLVEVMSYYCREKQLPVGKAAEGEGDTYYIIHPVLKHIALLSDEQE
jgi:methionyl-tRNA formyltransferase